MQETRPRPPAPPRARPTAAPWPRGAAGPAEMPSAGRDCRVGSGMDQAKGFIHRENTAHGDPCDSPETLPLAQVPTGSPRRISRHRPAPDYCNDHHTGPSHSIGPRAQHVMHIVHRAHSVHCVSGKGTQVLCIIAHIMPAIRVHIVLLCNRQGNASSLPYGSHVYPARERKFSCPYIVVYQPSSTSFVGVNGT
jgi:hypothetical protein